MRCIICESESKFFFSKTYREPPFAEFMKEIGTVEYYKCTECGFVLSKTHSELSARTWSDLNNKFHNYLERAENEKIVNQPPYVEQAVMLSILGQEGIINLDSILDYAAGYGSLSRLLNKYFGIELPIFDPFVKADDAERYVCHSELKTYRTVLNSAMFEHVLRREDLDSVNRLVANEGCLIIHTVVCENIPKDPDWFYLTPPVHTAFHTNRSMERLMVQWGFKSSIYCPQSKCWVLMKQRETDIAEKISQINRGLQNIWFIEKSGFVDYWKGF